VAANTAGGQGCDPGEIAQRGEGVLVKLWIGANTNTNTHKTFVNIEFYRVAILLEPKPVCGTLFMEFP
jgi:hypothetical protein